MTAAGAPGVRETRILRGIGLIVGATLLFVCMNTLVKVLSAHLPVAQLIWARNLGHLLVILALFAPRHGGWRLFVTRRPGVQLARSLCLLASTTLFFTAIGHVPLADATAVSFTAPFVVAGLSGPLLRERVRGSQWLAIAAGFLGALVVIRPTGAGANPYAVLVFGSACGYALYQLLTRRVAGVDSPETSVTYSALIGTLVLCAVVPFFWHTPASLPVWLAMSVLGIFGGLGHYLVARAFLWGPAAILSPIHYAQLVWAATLGFVVFGDVPSAWTWLGAAIIIASGLYIALRESRRA